MAPKAMKAMKTTKATVTKKTGLWKKSFSTEWAGKFMNWRLTRVSINNRTKKATETWIGTPWDVEAWQAWNVSKAMKAMKAKKAKK